MSDTWRNRTRTAFRFWEQILKSWDEAPESAGQYAHLINHLNRFEKKTADTFKYILERGADPVYILHVLIKTCDESRVGFSSTLPQVFSQDRSGSLADLQDFHLITEPDLQTIEAATPALLRAGQSFDQVGLERLRAQFESMPEPPDLDGYVGEKASLWTSFTLETPSAAPPKGRLGEYWFNTGMVLLNRHLIQTGPPRGARHPSIALLMNAFCPATYDQSPLRGELVRQRISSIEDRVAPYCEHFERWFGEWKLFLHRHPTPFNPWQS